MTDAATTEQVVDQQAAPQATPDAPASDAQAVAVQEPQLDEAVDSGAVGGGQIDILLDTEMTITACLGEVTIAVRELLQMGQGSVLTLDKQVGQPLDLYLRGVRFATGKLVVVGSQLGIRVEEILPAAKPAAK